MKRIGVGIAVCVISLTAGGASAQTSAVRGRVTNREAVYQLELIGREARVNEAIWSLRAATYCP